MGYAVVSPVMLSDLGVMSLVMCIVGVMSLGDVQGGRADVTSDVTVWDQCH